MLVLFVAQKTSTATTIVILNKQLKGFEFIFGIAESGMDLTPMLTFQTHTRTHSGMLELTSTVLKIEFLTSLNISSQVCIQ